MSAAAVNEPTSTEFVENDSPAAEFIEDVEPEPASKPTLHQSEPHIVDRTRRTLAVGMLWLVGGLAGVPTLALVLTHWTHFQSDDYRELSLVFTPIVALASAAFGFFFASDDRDRF